MKGGGEDVGRGGAAARQNLGRGCRGSGKEGELGFGIGINVICKCSLCVVRRVYTRIWGA